MKLYQTQDAAGNIPQNVNVHTLKPQPTTSVTTQRLTEAFKYVHLEPSVKRMNAFLFSF